MKLFTFGLACVFMNTIQSLTLKAVPHSKSYQAHQTYPWENNQIKCTATDKDCWEDWFQDNLDCDYDDSNKDQNQNNDDDKDLICLEDADDAFTCTLADPACWATKIKNFPCSANDKTCLNDLLPDDIPCNFGETCWNNPNLSGSRA